MEKIVLLLILGSAAFLALFLIFHFLSLFVVLAALLGISILVITVLIAAVIFIATLIAIPYYLIKKKPEVQEYGNYELEVPDDED